MIMDNSFDVVISGIGGHFPECDYADTFMEKVHLGESLLTMDDRRWARGKLGLDLPMGKVSHCTNFDNTFFGMHAPLAAVTDPMIRLLLERVTEAIFDSGHSLQDFEGRNTCVYTSCSTSEGEASSAIFQRQHATAIIGSNRSMMANRISHFLNLTGRSTAYDGSWAWAGLGLQMAYQAIKSGECDSVIMGSACLCNYPEMALNFASMNIVSPDGVCRPFDADANGIVRSETQVVFLIQRSDQAKRAYAKVLGAKMSYDGIREREILSPTVRAVASTVESVYKDYKINKKNVKYVECYGSGYQPNDYAEVEGLKIALCENRDVPLLIGSVQGNTGNTEGSIGMVSLVKAISILRTGIIPKTLNYKTPNPRIPSLVDGSVQVVSDNTPIVIDDDTIIASSSLAFQGTLAHVALGVASKNKEAVNPDNEIPRLILACGRSAEELTRILTKISQMPFDPEYYRLVQDIFSHPNKRYNFRGHVVCPSPPEISLNIERGGRIGRPVWFIFTGMGSQWPEMGRDLLKIPAFAATIDRCHAVLETKGLDLRKILTYPKADIFSDILHSFVGIAAVQIGLINVMRLLEIKPEGYIGHSVGEQACAYMDGCLSEEQMMLAAYARGMASNEANLIKGMMAAVGIGYENIKDQLPASIEVACHNSSESCTISGPADDVNEYVETLKKQNVFARAVNVSNTAYHSRYVKNAGPILMRRLSEVITEPKERSERWISTSAPEELWQSDNARFCSATYLTNNLLGAVLFEEAMKFVPEDVILIEIAPHGLMQPILRRSSPRGATNISLTQRNSADGLQVLYNAIAKMYSEGLCPKVSNLYADIQFPVSRQTPGTADLATFESVPFQNKVESVIERDLVDDEVRINIETPSDILRGIAFTSPSYFLCRVWEEVSIRQRFAKNQMMIEFQNVQYSEPVLNPLEGEHVLVLQILQGTCYFEICDSNFKIVSTGNYKTDEELMINKNKEHVEREHEGNETKISACYENMPPDAVILTADQLYSELAIRGHTYRANRMAITSLQISKKVWCATINHKGNIGTVLAASFQLIQLHRDQSTQICAYPKYLQRLFLDPQVFFEAYPIDAKIFLHTELGQVSCAGLTITGLQFRPIQTDSLSAERLHLHASSLSFIPYRSNALQSVDDVASVALQLARDNQPTLDQGVDILQLCNRLQPGHLHKKIIDALWRASYHHGIEINWNAVNIDKDTKLATLPEAAKTCNIIISESSTISTATTLLEFCPSAFLLAHLRKDEGDKVRQLKMLAEHVGDSDRVVFLRQSALPLSITEIVMVPPDEPVPQSANNTAAQLFVWTSTPSIGVQAAVAAIVKLARGRMFRMMFIVDKNAPTFSLSHPLYSDQLALGMRINILQDGVWGSFKTLPLPLEAHIISNSREWLQATVSTKTVDGVKISHWGVAKLSSATKQPELGLDFCGQGPNGLLFGVARAVDGQPRLDPLLQWPVPPGWTAADASTVPLAYCQAYLALNLLTAARYLQDEQHNIIVTDPLRPEGQAAVRTALATKRVAKVFTIAHDEREKEIIESLFSDAVNVRKHKCVQTGHRSLGNALNSKHFCGIGIDVIITSNPDDVRTDVFHAIRLYGCLICFGGAETAARKTIGMGNFVNCTSLFFVQIGSVLRMRDDNRHSVHAVITEGLKPDGFIKPLRRLFHSYSSTEHILWEDPDTTINGAVLKIEPSKSPLHFFKSGSCLIAGGTPQQQVHLAHWCAKRAIRTIVLVHAQYQSQFFTRHANLLSSVYGAELKVYSRLQTSLTEALRLGPIVLMLSVAQDSDGENAALELAKFQMQQSSKQPNMPFIVFGPEGSEHGTVADFCRTRRQEVVHSLLVVGRVDQAVNSRLTDWLLSAERPPAITLLSCPDNSRVESLPAARLLKLLPQGGEALAALGRSFDSKNKASRLVQLATNGPKHLNATEVFPLFVVPGFGASIDNILQPLADKMLNPLICVRLPDNMDSVVQVAEEITGLIKKRQPDGPFSLLGFDWTATLTQEIAQRLQQNGEEVIVFLMDGESSDANEVALLSQREDFERLILSSCLNLPVNSKMYDEMYALPTWSEKVNRLVPTSGEGDQVTRALNAIRGWVDVLARHKVCQSHADTHLIQTSAPAEVTFTKANRLNVFRCTETQAALLTTPKLQHYINDHMGYPCQQTMEARVKRAR